MRLRSYRPSDLPALHKLDQACFPPGIAYTRRELARFIGHARSRTWVAEEENQIVGFAIANQESREVAHMITIDVPAGWRRRGIGNALMEAVEEWARGRQCQMLYLETAEDNLVAQEFYRQRGYIQHEKVEHYYANGMAAWVMLKWLK
jgi:ribosomal-protein-alanine N-acetyltransferase